MPTFLKRIFSLPFFPILVAPVILFSRALFTGQVLFWGLPVLQFYPWREFAWQSLQAGSLPLWNSLNGLGAPLLANYQLALFYPPGWLVYLAALIGGSGMMAWVHALLVVLHLMLAGAGMALFTRSLGLGVLAQTISGLAFSLSGYFVARSSVFPMIWAGAWLPWILYAVNEQVKQERIHFSFKLLAFMSLQLLSGHAQLTWYSLLLAGLWMVIFSWVQHGPRRAVLGGLVFGGTLLAGAALSSVQLLPTAEYLLQSQRSSAVDFELGLTYSFWPWHLLNWLSPDFFGNPGSGTYFGYAAYWEDAVYIGLIPFIFSLSTLKILFPGRNRPVHPQRSRVMALWILAAAGFVFALGKNTPLFPWLYANVPTFGMFNAPARWMVWGVFCLSALAGIGAEGWKAPVGKIRRRLKLGLVVTIAVALGAGITFVALRQVKLTFIEATAVAGAWGALFCLAALKMPKAATGLKTWSLVLSGLVAADLILAQWPLIVTADAGLVVPAGQAVSLPPGERVYLSYQDEYNVKYERFFRIDNFTPLEPWGNIWSTLLPNINLAAGVGYVNNFDPLLPGRYATVINYLNQLAPAARLPWLQLMNVGTVESLDPTLAAGVRFDPVSAGGRFQWFGCAQFARDGPEAWDLTRQLLAAAPRNGIVLEGTGESYACPGGAPAEVHVVRDQTNNVEVSVNVPGQGGGWLLQADSWYPGWKASIDGVETPVLRADYFLRAVQVPSGSHTIVISYQPQSFRIGAIVSGTSFTIILIIILIIRIEIRRRNTL